jgi:alkylhydroperoxidase/carboxymuconolactone decarboxylase family protein YurZ
MIAENGWMPNPLKLMEKRPGTAEKSFGYNKRVLAGTLSKRERALISIAATVALKANHCIHSKVEDAKKAAVSEAEQRMSRSGAGDGECLRVSSRK